MLSCGKILINMEFTHLTPFDQFPKTENCGICLTPVSFVRFTHMDFQGNEYTEPLYKPESKYWRGTPTAYEVVFCSPECSLKDYKATHGDAS